MVNERGERETTVRFSFLLSFLSFFSSSKSRKYNKSDQNQPIETQDLEYYYAII